MPHIALPEGVPGILGPMTFRPETAVPKTTSSSPLVRARNSAHAP